MKPLPRYKKSGITMLLVLPFSLLLLMSMAFFLLPASQSFGRQENRQYLEAVARAIAESGVHKMLAALKSGQPLAPEFSQELGEGRLLAQTSSFSASQWHIRSTGILNKAPEIAVYVDAEVAKEGEKFIIIRWSEGKYHAREQK
jgi:hypothetical protein